MPFDLSLIKTVFIVMMENRSFDHLVGYLRLDSTAWTNVEGLRSDSAWQDHVASLYGGSKYPPFEATDPYDVMKGDPPHERDPIATQMGVPVNGIYPMNGFVANYVTAPGASAVFPGSLPPVMGYFTKDQVPVTDFFAENFALCDHWFSALPAGTQPNRLMAMSGFTNIDVNHTPLPQQDLLYDWLTEKGIRWRVYHEGLPFFAMMPNWIPAILDNDLFRPLEQLYNDIENDPPGDRPQVIFIEPTYTDAPHFGAASDDHAPSAVKGGQEFLLEAYRGVTRLPDVWSESVMIVTYDEHGGFFDHISPPPLRTDPPPGVAYKRGFETLGVRVPGFVISPFVKPKTVFNGVLDHTSILKFLGQKFGDGSYSRLVDNRAVGSVADVFNQSEPLPAPTIPSLDPYLAREPEAGGFTPGTSPSAPLPKSFQIALDKIRRSSNPGKSKFADLLDAFPPYPELA
jgi:phospholipase C